MSVRLRTEQRDLIFIGIRVSCSPLPVNMELLKFCSRQTIFVISAIVACTLSGAHIEKEYESKPSPLDNHVLSELTTELKAHLFPKLDLVALPLGNVLYESGDQLRYVYLPTRFDSVFTVRNGEWSIR